MILSTRPTDTLAGKPPVLPRISLFVLFASLIAKKLTLGMPREIQPGMLRCTDCKCQLLPDLQP